MTTLIKKTGMLMAMLLISICGVAQSNDQADAAESFVQSGKIYVVVAVVSVIFTGIITYLILLDRKISKLEKKGN